MCPAAAASEGLDQAGNFKSCASVKGSSLTGTLNTGLYQTLTSFTSNVDIFYCTQHVHDNYGWIKGNTNPNPKAKDGNRGLI